MTETGAALSEEAADVADFHPWFDNEGCLRWLRDIATTGSSATDSRVVIDIQNGFGCSTVYSCKSPYVYQPRISVFQLRRPFSSVYPDESYLCW